MTFILLNNRLYMEIKGTKQLKEVSLYSLSGRAIRDCYVKDNSVVIEVI